MIFLHQLNETIEYPLHDFDIRERLSEFAFPANLKICDKLIELGYRVVTEVPPPSYNPMVEKIIEDGVELINEVWYTKWKVVQYTISERTALQLHKVEETKKYLLKVITDKLDEVAMSMDYTDRNTICSYSTSEVLKFRNEANAFIIYRDLVWEVSLRIQSEMLTGVRAVTTAEQLLSELPVFTYV